FLGIVGVAWGLWRLTEALGLFAIFSDPTTVRLARINREFDSGLTGNLRTLLLPAALYTRIGSAEGYLLIGTAATWALLSTERLFLPLVLLVLAVGWLFRAGHTISVRHLAQLAPFVILSFVVF